jgi:phage terminase small subunit
VTARRSPKKPPEPPEHLEEDVADVWRTVVAEHQLVEPIDRVGLEAYCTTVVRYRAAAAKVAEEGLVVAGGRGPIVHPALAVERQLADQVTALAGRVLPRRAPARRRGPMYDATKASVDAAVHLSSAKYTGPVAAVLTLAWLIDEAQRAGLDALQRAAFGAIPSYLKACAELQITPASVPTTKDAKPRKSKLTMLRGGADGAEATG